MPETELWNTLKLTETLRVPNCPSFQDVLTQTQEAYLKKHGNGNPLGEWVKNTTALGKLSPRELPEEKQRRTQALLEKMFPKKDFSARLKRKFLSKVLKMSTGTVLNLPHIDNNANVLCLTLPKGLYQLFSYIVKQPVYQGFASGLPLTSYTIFDMIAVSSNQKIGNGMSPEKVQLHEATHCVDIMSQFRKESDSKLISEMIAVLGERANNQDQTFAVSVVEDYFSGYIHGKLITNPDQATLQLFGIRNTEELTQAHLAKKVARFIAALSEKINNADLVLLFMQSKSLAEIHHELKSRFKNYFSDDGYFTLP